MFTLIVGPSIEGKQIGKTKKDLGERGKLRLEFWTKLLNFAKEKTKLHASISPGQYSWVGTSAGVRGVAYNYVLRQHDSVVEVYIDLGADQDSRNLEIYQSFARNKDKIEDVFGENLIWEPLENRRACRVSFKITIGGWKDQDKWDVMFESMVNKMIRMEKAFKPFLKKIKS